MNLCIDCTHFIPAGDKCGHPNSISPINGVRGVLSAHNARAVDGFCGPEGVCFEGKGVTMPGMPERPDPVSGAKAPDRTDPIAAMADGGAKEKPDDAREDTRSPVTKRVDQVIDDLTARNVGADDRARLRKATDKADAPQTGRAGADEGFFRGIKSH